MPNKRLRLVHYARDFTRGSWQPRRPGLICAHMECFAKFPCGIRRLLQTSKATFVFQRLEHNKNARMKKIPIFLNLIATKRVTLHKKLFLRQSSTQTDETRTNRLTRGFTRDYNSPRPHISIIPVLHIPFCFYFQGCLLCCNSCSACKYINTRYVY